MTIKSDGFANKAAVVSELEKCGITVTDKSVGTDDTQCVLSATKAEIRGAALCDSTGANGGATVARPDPDNGGNRTNFTAINIAGKDADARAADLKTQMGTGFTVFDVTDGNDASTAIVITGKTADSLADVNATNLGGVRYSSEKGAFTASNYTPYNSFDGGTEGTCAQVSYGVDISKLKPATP